MDLPGNYTEGNYTVGNYTEPEYPEYEIEPEHAEVAIEYPEHE